MLIAPKMKAEAWVIPILMGPMSVGKFSARDIAIMGAVQSACEVKMRSTAYKGTLPA